MLNRKLVGPPEVHDATVMLVVADADRCLVTLRPVEGTQLQFAFERVSHLISKNPNGMMLYAIHELPAAPPTRHFVFVNWGDDDPRSLEVRAERGSWKHVNEDSWQPV